MWITVQNIVQGPKTLCTIGSPYPVGLWICTSQSESSPCHKANYFSSWRDGEKQTTTQKGKNRQTPALRQIKYLFGSQPLEINIYLPKIFIINAHFFCLLPHKINNLAFYSKPKIESNINVEAL